MSYKKYVIPLLLAATVIADLYLLFQLTETISVLSKSDPEYHDAPTNTTLYSSFTDFAEWVTYHESGEWCTHYDTTYHFRIDHPCHLSLVKHEGYVGFVIPGVDGPGNTGSVIFIQPTSFETPEEAVIASNKKTHDEWTKYGPADENMIPKTVIDGPITINGYSGILTHRISDSYERVFPKELLFIKDGMLFTIDDGTYDYQRTWTSFYFE